MPGIRRRTGYTTKWAMCLPTGSGSAWFSGEEDFKGSIAPGMAADFAVLNHDILSVDEEKLLQTRSVLTVVDGQVNYSSGALD